MINIEKDIIEWLLEEDNPSVKYFVMRDILEIEENNPDLVKQRKKIMTSTIIQKILKKQNDDGSFYVPEQFYTNKYKGTVWTLLLLAELGADPNDPLIKKACEFILENSQDHETGGFSVKYSTQFKGGMPSRVIPCLTGNMVFALVRLGYVDDPRVQQAINWIATFQRMDDGEYKTPLLDKYKHHSACFGKHSCHMGVAKALKAFVEIPEEKRSPLVNEKIKEYTEYFLIHHIYKQSHNLKKISKSGWNRFGFPLMYQTDILELMELFMKLGIRDERLMDALDVIRTTQIEGKWLLKNTYNGKMITKIEEKDQPSKWVTFIASKILSYYDQI